MVSKPILFIIVHSTIQFSAVTEESYLLLQIFQCIDFKFICNKTSYSSIEPTINNITQLMSNRICTLIHLDHFHVKLWKNTD